MPPHATLSTTLTIGAGEITSTGVVTITAVNRPNNLADKTFTVSATIPASFVANAPVPVFLLITDVTPQTITATWSAAAFTQEHIGIFNVPLNFSEPVTGLGLGDFSVENGKATYISGGPSG